MQFGFGKLKNIRFAFQGFDLLPVSTCENPKVTYLYKATRQDMHTKATQELYPREGHKFHVGIIRVILVGKSNAIAVNVFDTCIADSHPMSVLP